MPISFSSCRVQLVSPSSDSKKRRDSNEEGPVVPTSACQPASPLTSHTSSWAAVDALLARRAKGRPSAQASVRVLHLALDLEASLGGPLRGMLLTRNAKGAFAPANVVIHDLSGAQDTLDLELLARAVHQKFGPTGPCDPLPGGGYAIRPVYGDFSRGVFGPSIDQPPTNQLRIEPPGASELLLGLAEEGRLHRILPGGEFRPLRLLDGAPWRVRVIVQAPGDSGACSEVDAEARSVATTMAAYGIYAVLERTTDPDARVVSATSGPVVPSFVHQAGIVVEGDRIGCIPAEHVAWTEALGSSAREALALPADALESFLDRFYAQSNAPPIRLPGKLELTEETVAPRLFLDIEGPDGSSHGLPVRAGLRYGGREVMLGAPGSGVVDLLAGRLYLRNPAIEEAAYARLESLGVRPPTRASFDPYEQTPPRWRVAARRIPELVLPLLAEGWEVSAERRRYRAMRAFNIEVTSGIDWLGLSGTVEFDDSELPLGAVLRALRKKQRQSRFVELGNGAIGVLPERWLARWELLASAVSTPTASNNDAPVRLSRVQVGTVLGLLEGAKTASVDQAFARLQKSVEQLGTPRAESSAKPWRYWHNSPDGRNVTAHRW
jgi:hypothetical protein